MRRIIAPLIVLALGLGGLLAYRLHVQDAQLHGPAGGSGQIEGTELRLSTRLSARILSVEVAEGASVRKGDLLLKLDCAEPESALTQARAQRDAAEYQTRAARLGAWAAERSRSAADAAINASRSQVQALTAQRDAVERQVGRLSGIGENIAASNLDELEASAKGLTHQVEAAEASVVAGSNQAKAAGDQARAALAQADAADAAVVAADAAVRRAKLLVDECEVRAPRDAVVEQLPFEPGELVAPGATLARLVDLGQVKATFYLPNAELASARPGTEALVTADAYAGQSFRGKVSTVASEAEFTPRNIQTRSDRDRLVYKVEVLLANPDGKLRPGMPVQVTLPGTQR